ncbi:MAG: exo-alpha-sialidase [Bacteroidetes bacterium]|nr:exo-alpha-sialidase [Bacteroidota bacterium]MBS1975210.1 exo-alpha-sialidase [Bacteroidota bacterium]
MPFIKILLSLICYELVLCNCYSQMPAIRNNYSSQKNVLRLSVESSMIYVPDSNWMYSHHASIARFNNKFIAIWSNGLADEDKPGQRVVFSVSTDFFHWSKPRVLAKPSTYKNDTLNVLTAAGFHQYRGTLVAYYGEYSPHRTNTHLWAKTTTDGEHWSNAINMHVPVNPNHGPEAIANGRLIISGNFTFPYTDDPKGLSGWKMTSFYNSSLYKEDNPATFYAPAEKNNLPPLCEGSFFQTDDHIIHTLLRVTGDGWKGKLWLTESKDKGEHWSFPVETTFTDNDSKFHFGRLPDKRFYYVGIPDTTHHYARTPLVLAISEDGKFFNRNYIIADEPYQLKKEGLWKDGQYGYPHTILFNGYMYVIISRQKEAVEAIRFRLAQLK